MLSQRFHYVDEPRRASARIFRHCEPTGRANARPMTGSAKQSRLERRIKLDCFVACAPSTDGTYVCSQPHAWLATVLPSAACAAASRAIGTREGEHET